jgi:hypothetical protein
VNGLLVAVNQTPVFHGVFTLGLHGSRLSLSEIDKAGGEGLDTDEWLGRGDYKSL